MMMKNYQVTGKVVSISSGIVELVKHQSDARMFALNPVGKNRFAVLKTIHFKHGETFGYDGELSKTLALELAEAVEEKQPKQQRQGEKEAAMQAEAEALADKE